MDDSGKKLLRVERAFLILSLVLGGFQAWISRYAMNPDGVSYLDIGDAYLRGDWKAAINGYWSPMYSVVLATAMRILKPSLAWEFPVVHLVNFVVFLVALFCFRIFLRSAAPWIEDGSDASDEFERLPAVVVLGIGYILFLWSSLVLIDLALATPDLLVAALVFLLGALLLDLRRRHSLLKFVAFGAVCGLGYLAKGFMFPMAFVFLAVLLFSGNLTKARMGGVLLAGFVFVIVSSSFIFALSKAKGRLTYGDTGKLAYAEMVSPQPPQMHWQGEPEGSGAPLHATRKILDDPAVFEYAEPVSGTYPPWYDPSYWNEGMHSQFRLRSQVRVLVQSARAYGGMLQSASAVIAGIAILLLIGGRSTLKGIAQNWPLVIIACAAAGLYALVLVHSRYIAGFAVLFFVGVLTGIRLPRNDKFEMVSKQIGIGVILAMFLSLAVTLGDTAYHKLTVGAGPATREHVEAAEGLQRMGFRANDRVAVLSDGLEDYWARLGRFKIVAEIASSRLDGREFWAAPAEVRLRAYEAVAGTKARAVIAWSPPAGELSHGWKQIGATQYYVHVLP